MDRITGLSDDLLVKILMFLPTKIAVSTSILSKRWERLWMWLPKLEFDDISYSEPECKSLRCFLDRNLLLHKGPVIESLCLKFSKLQFEPKDVKLWIVIAIYRHVRELEIYYSCYRNNPNILPSSLYTCESLVVLKLNGYFFLDVPRLVLLPSLKTLQLQCMVYSNEDCLQRLLSICPILEDLVVDFCIAKVGDMRKFSIIVPSLQSLSLCIHVDLDMFVINTPSLKYFKLEDHSCEIHSCLIENMPKLREAYVDVVVHEFSSIKSLFRSIKSVKSLSLCVKYNGIEAVCDDGFAFDKLEHLKLCVCQDFDLLVRFLNHSPNLRELYYFVMDKHWIYMHNTWTEPTMVPECILSDLQIFNWSPYCGSPGERRLAIYILENARRLKTATFSADDDCVPKLQMIKELAFSSRASTTCQLTFD